MEEPKGILKELLGWIVYIAVIIGLTWLIITFVGQRTRVSGHSMEATLHDGDNLIVDKLSYRFRDPKRFEIIVFPYRHKENTYYIKRIIGLPGETVQVKDGYVYNRNHSSDSRDPSVGILHIDELIGRAWIRIWPLDSIGVIPHE